MPSLIEEQSYWPDEDGLPVVNGKVYIGTQNNDPKTNLITIYSDRGLTTMIANPQLTDSSGRTVNKIWVPGKYSIQVDDTNDVQKYQELDAGADEKTGIVQLDNVQGTNTITAEGRDSPVSALIDNEQYNFRATNANTGAVTLQIDLTTAKTIKKLHDVDLAVGDIEQNQTVSVIYNSADDVFELVSNTSIGNFSSLAISEDIIVDEAADHTNTPVAGKGIWWVRNDAPNTAMFTDDAGNDHEISPPGVVTDHIRAGNTQIYAPDTHSATFNPRTATIATWESLGPTGSLADNIWTAMDSMPSNARIIILDVFMQATQDASLQLAATISATAEGTTPGTATPHVICRILGDHGNTDTPVINSYNQVMVPLDSSQRLQFQYSENNGSGYVYSFTYRGFITD